MPTVDINDVGKIGAVFDTKDYMLPPEAWTIAVNMRYKDDGLETWGGWAQVFGTPPVAPHFLFPLSTITNKYWIYTSLTKAYVWDGATHTNITRQTAGVDVNYSASNSYEWNGTLLGGVPILNNGIDVPQQWIPTAVGTKLANLANWPANTRARVIRAYGPYLIAINVSVGGVSYPHLVKWSNEADPGSVPTSWDANDPAENTGETDLPDTEGGVLVDARVLGQTMYLYKESSVWKMRFVGGRFIFDFGMAPWLTTNGILAERCVTTTGDGLKHVWATQDDIMWHDGNAVRSVLTGRQRRRLFNELDPVAFRTSFMWTNPAAQEVIFCYPTTGVTQPNRALIMNYGAGDDFIITEANGINFRHAATGPLESPSGETWADGTDLWSDDTGPWSQLLRRRTLIAATDTSKIHQVDGVYTRDGVPFASMLRRTGLGLIGRKRDGTPIVDFQAMKMFKRVWPKLRGTTGVAVRFVVQDLVDGPVRYGGFSTIVPTATTYIDPGPMSGRAVGLEFSVGGGYWGIDGYKIDIERMGEY